jgi:hypothetical protein
VQTSSPVDIPRARGQFRGVRREPFRIGLSGLVASGLAFALVCCKKEDSGKTPPPKATAAATAAQPTAAPNATASGALTAPADAGSLPFTFAAHDIPAGAGPTGAYTIPYSIERFAGDENKTWQEAVEACRSHDKSLCTETQWMKACALDRSLGTVQSWTLTADFPGAAVRGGKDGCGSRTFIKLSERSPTRVGVCCSRAIAIATPITTGTFREDMNEKILKYEAALNRGDAAVLAELYAPKVKFNKDELDGPVLARRHAAELHAAPDLLFTFDRCTLREEGDGASKESHAECGVVYHKAARARGLSTLIVWPSDGRISYYGDAKDYTPPVPSPKRETKERVSGFISSQ